MEDLENQLDKLCIDEKLTFNSFIEFINIKYPEQNYPIILLFMIYMMMIKNG